MTNRQVQFMKWLHRYSVYPDVTVMWQHLLKVRRSCCWGENSTSMLSVQTVTEHSRLSYIMYRNNTGFRVSSIFIGLRPPQLIESLLDFFCQEAQIISALFSSEASNFQTPKSRSVHPHPNLHWSRRSVLSDKEMNEVSTRPEPPCISLLRPIKPRSEVEGVMYMHERREVGERVLISGPPIKLWTGSEWTDHKAADRAHST